VSRAIPVPGEVVSVELTFDDRTEELVRAEWEALAEAGLSSMARHTAPGNRPHLTLLARRGDVTDAVAAAAADLPVPLTLGAPLLFVHGDRAVLARSVVPNLALLDLHARVHAAASGSAADLDHTVPGAWTPHVTLARRMRLDRIEAALARVGGDIPGSGVQLRRWDSRTATLTPLG
jgi:2'-5' RNA ligase